MKRYLVVFVLVFAFGVNLVTAQKFSTHPVKKGETVEGIAKRYFVAPSAIYKLNPDAKKGLKPNTVLIIPTSKPKVTEKKLQDFKTYKAKRKETLYSLAQKFNVLEDDIKKYNPFLYTSSLKKGDKLRIPKYKPIAVVEDVIKQVPISETKKYTVLPKEGKWRIASKFGITVEELEALNPKMSKVLKKGESLNVPDVEEKEVLDIQYGQYKVLPKEGFYRLKLKLGLDQADIEALNPELKVTGLRSGMILKIPNIVKNGYKAKGIGAINLVDSISNYDTKHIAIMLPFRMHRVDFNSSINIKKNLKEDPYLKASIDFYSGALMALDSLKSLGVSLKVDVYDTKYEVDEVAKIIEENNFKHVDAVIGPLTPTNFNKVALALQKYDTPVISPIGKDLKLYNNIFQSRPANDLLKKKVINFVKSDSLVENIIIISDTETEARANELKNEFYNAKRVNSRKSKEGEDEFFITKLDVENVLKPGKNIVFLETRNEGYVSNVTSLLASLNKKTNAGSFEIILVTTNINSAFNGDQINNMYLSNLQFHYATASKEYDENEDNTFVKKYNKLYNSKPNKRVVRGFDLTMDVVLRLVSSKDLYTSVATTGVTQYVENQFAYKKTLLGGYFNDSVYLVKYQDLIIVEVE